MPTFVSFSPSYLFVIKTNHINLNYNAKCYIGVVNTSLEFAGPTLGPGLSHVTRSRPYPTVLAMLVAARSFFLAALGRLRGLWGRRPALSPKGEGDTLSLSIVMAARAAAARLEPFPSMFYDFFTTRRLCIGTKDVIFNKYVVPHFYHLKSCCKIRVLIQKAIWIVEDANTDRMVSLYYPAKQWMICMSKNISHKCVVYMRGSCILYSLSLSTPTDPILRFLKRSLRIQRHRLTTAANDTQLTYCTTFSLSSDHTDLPAMPSNRHTAKLEFIIKLSLWNWGQQNKPDMHFG